VFFFVSKIFWMIASPINLLLFGALIGVLLCFGRRARFGRGLALAAILVLAAAATLPVGKLLIARWRTAFLYRRRIWLPRRGSLSSAARLTTG